MELKDDFLGDFSRDGLDDRRNDLMFLSCYGLGRGSCLPGASTTSRGRSPRPALTALEARTLETPDLGRFLGSQPSRSMAAAAWDSSR